MVRVIKFEYCECFLTFSLTKGFNELKLVLKHDIDTDFKTPVIFG